MAPTTIPVTFRALSKISTGVLHFSAPAQKIERWAKSIFFAPVQEKFGSQKGRFSTREAGFLEEVDFAHGAVDGEWPRGQRL
jgi:hypothetical protein